MYNNKKAKREEFQKSSVAHQVGIINRMKADIAKQSSRYEKLALLEKDPTATLEQLRRKREHFLRDLTDRL